MVRRTKRPVNQKLPPRLQHPANAVNLRRLDRLLLRHRRHDRRQPLRQHRLPCPRRPHHQQIVPTRRRHLQRPLHILLSLHIRKINLPLLTHRKIRHRPPRRRQQRCPTRHMLKCLPQAPHPDHRHPLNNARLLRILPRHNHLFPPARPRTQRNRQNPLHRPHRPVQRQLPHHAEPVKPPPLRIIHPVRDHPHRNRQIKTRPLFPQIRRSQIDRRPARLRPGITGIRNRRPHPVPTLPHRRIRQPHNHRRPRHLPRIRLVHLNLHLQRIHPMQGSRKYSRQIS